MADQINIDGGDIQFFNGAIIFCVDGDGSSHLATYGPVADGTTFKILMPCCSCVTSSLSGVADDTCSDCDDNLNGDHTMQVDGTCEGWYLISDVPVCSGTQLASWSMGFSDTGNDLVLLLDVVIAGFLVARFQAVIAEGAGGGTVCVNLMELNATLDPILTSGVYTQCDFTNASVSVSWTDCP